MRKVLTFITAMFLMSSFFISSPVLAVESQVDQSCGQVSGTTTVWRANGITQYFKPTLNHLTKIAVKVQTNVGQPASYILILRNSLGQQLFTQSFNLDSNGDIVGMPTNVFDIEVATGSLYSVQIVRGATGTNHLYWAYTQNTNCNPNGYAYYDGVVQAKDMAFYTYGYNVTPPETPSSPPANPESPAGTSGTTAATSTSSSSTTAKATAPVDNSIKKPELTGLEKDDSKIEVPVKGNVSVTNKNKLKIMGTTIPGTTVVVFVGDTAYDATVDKDGVWLVSLDGAKVKEGEYNVQAQAQKESKGSEKTDLFKLVVSKEKAVAQNTASKKGLDMNKFYLAGLSTVLVLLCFLLYLENRRVKGLSKKTQPKAIKNKSPEIK